MRAMEAALPVQDLQVLAYGDLRGGEAVGQVLHQHSPVALDHFQDGATAFLVEHNFLVPPVSARRIRSRAGRACVDLRADVSSRPTGALPYLSFLFRTFPFGCPIKKVQCAAQPRKAGLRLPDSKAELGNLKGRRLGISPGSLRTCRTQTVRPPSRP